MVLFWGSVVKIYYEVLIEMVEFVFICVWWGIREFYIDYFNDIFLKDDFCVWIIIGEINNIYSNENLNYFF